MRTYRNETVEKPKAALNGLFSRFFTFYRSFVRFVGMLVYGPEISIVAVLRIYTSKLGVIYVPLKYKINDE